MPRSTNSHHAIVCGNSEDILNSPLIFEANSARPAQACIARVEQMLKRVPVSLRRLRCGGIGRDQHFELAHMSVSCRRVDASITSDSANDQPVNFQVLEEGFQRGLIERGMLG